MSKLYIAYGSNLNMEQMRLRCDTAQFIGTGTLENYELQFKGRLHNAYATIAPKEGSSVPIAIWKIKKEDELNLDRCEGYGTRYGNFYDKGNIAVKMDNGKMITGMVYIMNQAANFGNPSKSYYDTVQQGYIDCGFDTTVLDKAVDKSMDLAQQRMRQGGMRMW